MACDLQIPKKFHSDLIGHGGSVIRRLESSFSVNVTIPNRDDSSCIVSIVGPPAGIDGCRREIANILKFEVGEDPLLTAQLDIPSSVHGRLIGPRGSTLQNLETQHGCAIEIPRRGQDGPVTIQGAKGHVERALEAIREIVEVPFSVLGTETSDIPAPRAHINLQAREPIHEVLFFPERPNQPSFQRFLTYLDSAEHTAEICVFTISDDRIYETIMRLHAHGVKVRVITDDECMTNQGSDILKLRNAGIPVRTDHSEYHMHHKFAVLDSKVILTGSFNWTYGAATHNQENICISNEPQLVKPYQAEFERLWKQFAH